MLGWDASVEKLKANAAFLQFYGHKARHTFPFAEDNHLLVSIGKYIVKKVHHLCNLYILPFLEVLLKDEGAVCHHPHLRKEQHQPPAVLLGHVMEFIVLVENLCEFPFELCVIVCLRACHRNEQVLVTSLGQLQLHALLGSSKQFFPDLLADGIQIPITDDLAGFLVKQDMFFLELVIGSETELVNQLHIGIQFFQFIFQRGA